MQYEMSRNVTIIRNLQKTEKQKEEEELQRKKKQYEAIEERKRKILRQKELMQQQQQKFKENSAKNSRNSQKQTSFSPNSPKSENNGKNETENQPLPETSPVEIEKQVIDHIFGNQKAERRTFKNSDQIECFIKTPPSDPKVRKIVENLALFVYKHGVSFENVVHVKNRANPNFSWLSDRQSDEYKYYLWQLYSHVQAASDEKAQNSDADQNDLEDLHEEEKGHWAFNNDQNAKGDGRPSSSAKNTKSETKFHAVPPPSMLSSGPKGAGAFLDDTAKAKKARPHMFSVIGVHENKDSQKRKRRRFTDAPEGDFSKRTVGDTVSQIEFFADKADQTEQRREVPLPPTIESDEDSDEGCLQPASHSAKGKGRGRRGNLGLGAKNVGRKMLERMGWKEGASLGKK